MARTGYLFLDACGFEAEAKRRNIFLDFDELRTRLELEFNCVFNEKHYFNSVENPHERNDYHAKLQRLGWTFHLFGYKTVRRQVVHGSSDKFVKFNAADGSQANPLPGTYEFTVQAGVDSALVTAMSLLQSQAPSTAVFVLIASDGDFHSTLNLLSAARDVHVVFWKPAATGATANLAAGLTKFLKTKPRQPGESENYLFLDEILTQPFVRGGPKASKLDPSEWICECGFKNNVLNDVCGGKGEMGCKRPRPATCSPPPAASSLQQQAMHDSSEPPGNWSGRQVSETTEWLCECGFRNNYLNEVCGGKGEMGCKRPKPPRSASQSLRVQAAPDTGGNRSGYQATEPLEPASTKGGRSVKDGWVCACGFSNKPTNSVCGGTGAMGCKAERSEWVCDCGFTNKPINQVCGGTGVMGCKKPRSQYQ